MIIADTDQTVFSRRRHGQIHAGRSMGMATEDPLHGLGVVQINSATVGDHSQVEFLLRMETNVGDSKEGRSNRLEDHQCFTNPSNLLFIKVQTTHANVGGQAKQLYSATLVQSRQEVILAIEIHRNDAIVQRWSVELLYLLH